MAISNFIPTVWSENLFQALDKQYIAVSHCNREYEGEIREKGSVVKICGLGDISVFDYTKNTNMNAPSSLSDNVRELTINQAKAFNFQIDDIDRAQATPKLMNEAMRKAAAALASVADTYVYSLVDQASHTVTESDTTASNIIDKLIEAQTTLMEANVTNPTDIVFEVSPAIAALIFKAKVQLLTDNSELLESGCIGALGGSKIFVSNNIPKTLDSSSNLVFKCMARTKRAIAFAEQLSEIDAYRPELRFADAVKGLHLYGAKVVYPNEVVKLSLTVQN